MGASRGLAFSTNFLKTWPECWEETSCGNILLGWISKSDFSQSFWHVWQWICLHHDDPQYPKRLLGRVCVQCTAHDSCVLVLIGTLCCKTGMSHQNHLDLGMLAQAARTTAAQTPFDTYAACLAAAGLRRAALARHQESEVAVGGHSVMRPKPG